MVHSAMDAYHVQFESGPTVYVRKTFLDIDDSIDIDDCIDMPEIKRGSTAPARVTFTDDDDDADSDDAYSAADRSSKLLVEVVQDASEISKDTEAGDDNEVKDIQTALAGCIPASLTASNDVSIEQQENAGNEDLEPPPCPTDLCRHTTYDSFEHEGPWSVYQGGFGTPMEVVMQPASMVMLPDMASDTEMSAGMFPIAWMHYVPSNQLDANHLMENPIESFQQPFESTEPQAADSPEEHEAPAFRAPSIASGSSVVMESFDYGTSSVVVPQPQTLVRSFCPESGTYRMYWIVDARKLKANDKVAVSPAFEISCGSGDPLTLKLMMYPKAISDGKGCASFKKAKGRGFVQLKCESDVRNFKSGPLTYCLGISSGSWEGAKQEAPRGPVTHNFADGVVCGLPKVEGEWDFNHVVDQASQTLAIYLDILPQGST